MVAADVQALLDAAVDAIVVIDGRGQIVTFSRAAERYVRLADAGMRARRLECGVCSTRCSS
jgi:PAS domain-containing protein